MTTFIYFSELSDVEKRDVTYSAYEIAEEEISNREIEDEAGIITAALSEWLCHHASEWATWDEGGDLDAYLPVIERFFASEDCFNAGLAAHFAALDN
ncbi:MAG: hypothetical protein ACTH30_10560 [Leucobacter sp.]